MTTVSMISAEVFKCILFKTISKSVKEIQTVHNIFTPDLLSPVRFRINVSVAVVSEGIKYSKYVVRDLQ